ncbi:family 43 glycosylhydrolase [Mangrovibacterium lignilyticum]|uniref:family 43 glycosylhydrolase n=1 Tax=Mangrovibacterium lignilyticum TaxID=2668052 RepID=UPI0013D737AA|nr:family 43 glycosylhydrolase [Mangrovibacterium lignilyticum]
MKMRSLYHMLFLMTILLSLASCNLSKSEIQESSIMNPVLPGDRPNPTVVQIGNYYYASATSNEWSPLFPIYKSADLLNWELISYVFPSGAPEWAENNFWAPELVYDENQDKLFVYYTCSEKESGMLTMAVASADTPEGPFNDLGPLDLSERGSVDGFEMRDENGNLFLIWREAFRENLPTVFFAQPISENRTRMVGPRKELIRNDCDWERVALDGPALFRKGDYFYMFYSAGNCCEMNCDYKIGVARSKKLMGPWEKYDANPILTNNEFWKCPGTGTVIEVEGDYYFLYHAFRTNGGDFLGREGILAKVDWTEDGWPLLKNNTQINRPVEELDFSDDFSEALNPVWQWRATQNLAYSTSENGLMLAASNQNNDIGNLLVQFSTSNNYEIIADVDIDDTGLNAGGGIALIGASNNGMGAPIAGVGISVDHNMIQVWKMLDDENNIYDAVQTPPGNSLVSLKMEVNHGCMVRFSFYDGERWNVIADSINASSYVPWGMGFRWGLTSHGKQGEYVNISKVELHHKELAKLE